MGEARANINQQGKSQMTAIHLAARNGNAMMARILLLARADPNHKSACGTAVELAIKNGRSELLQVFGIAESQEVQATSHSQCQVNSVASMSASQRAALFID